MTLLLINGVLLAAVASVASAAPAWDHAASYQQLGYAQAAYCMAGFESWDCGKVCDALPALQDLHVITANATRGLAFVGWHHEDGEEEDGGGPVIVVSFRGTLSRYFENWWSDLSSVKLDTTPYCPWKGCAVGDGFLRAYNELVAEGLISAILEVNQTAMQASALGAAAPRVRVTGHSLGASLASICAVQLYQKGARLDSVVTFGSPRTGNPTFARWYHEIIFNRTRYAFRVTHYRDPIVHLPPLNYFVSFQHVPREVFFSEKTGDKKKICDGSGEDHSCSYAWTPIPSSRDHLNYMDMPIGSDQCA